MSIQYPNLDTEVRKFMLREIEMDEANKTLYISPRLTAQGAQTWPVILREAMENHDDGWLASELRSRGFMRTHEERRKPKGGFTTAKVPVTAPDTLAEGEFNRFYARGLCASVVASGGTEVMVFRGKQVTNPRPESEAMIGRAISAKQLLEDLRTSQGVEPALGLPPGPNSGLTIRRL
jgi:hypothetical protein